MGRAKEALCDRLEDEYYEIIADELEMPLEELYECDFDLHENHNNDGMLSSYYVEFNEDSPQEILENIEFDFELTVELDRWIFDGSEDYSDYYGYYGIPSSQEEAFELLNIGLVNLKRLAQINITEIGLNNIHQRLVFSGVITALETFLSDSFLSLTMNNENYYQNFIETSNKNIRLDKFVGKEDMHEKLKQIVKEEILKISFHNIKQTRKLYKDTLDIDINCPQYNKIINAVKKRHDFVHRDGKDKDGNIVTTDISEILSLIDNVNAFSTLLIDSINVLKNK